MNDNHPRSVHFRYLDQLRASGVVNMFGAERYLAEGFGLDAHEARTILIEWMKGFAPKKPDET